MVTAEVKASVADRGMMPAARASDTRAMGVVRDRYLTGTVVSLICFVVFIWVLVFCLWLLVARRIRKGLSVGEVMQIGFEIRARTTVERLQRHLHRRGLKEAESHRDEGLAWVLCGMVDLVHIWLVIYWF